MAIRATLLATSALIAAAVAAGCYTGSAVDVNRTPDVSTSTDGTAPLKAGSNVHGLTHLPCDVEKMLSDACWQCHGTVPGYGADTQLVYQADLAADTPIGLKQADVCLIRMQSQANMMPPDNAATADQIKVLNDWITAGYPVGHCGEDADAGVEAGAGGDDDDTPDAAAPPPSVCTSNTTIPTTTKNSTMRPGEACLGCHNADATTTFTLAGTVYPTSNEPDDCVGAKAASIVIIDANSATHTYTSNSSGNFYTEDDVPGPYKVMLVNGAKTTEMKSLVSSGDCNSCHTANPQAGQPGRIIGP